MTTGSYVDDLRVWVQYPCGLLQVGRYAKKTWSGIDYPKTPPTKHVVPGGVHYEREYYYDDARASMRHRKVAVIGGPRTFYTRDVPFSVRETSEEHPYSCTWEKSRYPTLQYRWGSNPFVYGNLKCFGGAAAPANPWTPEDDYKLVLKLRNQISGNFHGGVALAEVDKTLSMIRGTVKKLAQAIGHAQKGNWYAASRVLGGRRKKTWHKTAPFMQNWLELQYGWLPLYGDVYAGAQALSHYFNVPPRTVYYVTRRKLGSLPGSGSPSNYQWSEGSNIARVRIKAIVSEVNYAQLTGLLDPLSVIWERIPYSFVFDWFIPVGTYLEALNATKSITGTFVVSKKWEWQVSNPVGVGTLQFLHSYGATSQSRGEFSRQIKSHLDIPLPINFRGLERSLSLKHTANAVALLTTLSRGRLLYNGVRY